MSRFNLKKITLWLTAIMLCAFAVAGSVLATEGFEKTFFLNDKSNKQDINTTENFPVSEIQNISIDTISSDINVIPTDEKGVKVHWYGTVYSHNKNFPECISKMDGSTLRVEIRQKIKINLGFSFDYSKIKLDIFVPKSYAGNLEADTTSGNLNIQGLTLKKLSYNTVSGNLKASSISTENTKTDTTSGNVFLNDFTGDFHGDSVSGDTKILYAAFSNSIDIDTTSGDSEITLPGNSIFKVNFDTVSGDFKNDFARAPETTNKITVDSVSGNLSIKKDTIH